MSWKRISSSWTVRYLVWRFFQRNRENETKKESLWSNPFPTGDTPILNKVAFICLQRYGNSFIYANKRVIIYCCLKELTHNCCFEPAYTIEHIWRLPQIAQMNTDVFWDLVIGFLPFPLAVSKEKRKFAFFKGKNKYG